jgi:diaminopimelate epimerase
VQRADGLVNFAKLHGAGNDFLLFDGGEDPSLAGVLPALVPRLCDRRLGIGADGVLLLVRAGTRAARLEYWNADGTGASFCANGTRCAARFAALRWHWHELVLLTGFAPVPARVHAAEVELELPAPTEVHPWQEFTALAGSVRGRYMVLGVPHLIVPVEWPDFWRRPLAPLAPALRAHAELPAGGANVSFVRHAGEGVLAVRSWERGIEAETLSCGSGDVAAALVALAERWTAAPVRVETASGRTLVVAAKGATPQCPSTLTGPAEWIADGTVAPELLGAI